MSTRYLVALWVGCFAQVTYEAVSDGIAGNVSHALVAGLGAVAILGIGYMIVRNGEASQ